MSSPEGCAEDAGPEAGEARMTRGEVREQLVANIMDRVDDLRSCTKADNCRELADLIESYIPEWTDFLEEGEQGNTPLAESSD